MSLRVVVRSAAEIDVLRVLHGARDSERFFE
jgi:plasmid stabilization system protein ParE